MSELDRRFITYLVVGGLLYFMFLRARPAFPSGVLIDPTTGVPVTSVDPLGGGGGGSPALVGLGDRPLPL